MARKQVLQAAPDDPLVLAHGDPDERPGLVADGLLVDGADPFAARRRMMRERHDGRPDPAPPAQPPRQTAAPIPTQRQEDTMTLTTTLAERPASQAAAPLASPGSFKIITAAELSAVPGGRGKVQHALSGAVDAIVRGECVRVSVAAPRASATRHALRKLAAARGLALEIRSGPDYVAARSAGPLTDKEKARPS